VARRRRLGLAGGIAIGPFFALLSTSAVAADVDAAALVKESCAACHTETGNSVPPPFPKLAGLSPDYLAKQLRDVIGGSRKSEIMQPIATKLSRKEIAALARYYGAQRRTPGIVTDPTLISAGVVLFTEGDRERGVPGCACCHGTDGVGAPGYPNIASQNAGYVYLQLQEPATASARTIAAG